MSGCHQDGLRPSSKYRGLCRLEAGAGVYPDHQCDSVFPPSMTEVPPDQHKPTPAPHKSIFHEMMVSSASFTRPGWVCNLSICRGTTP